MKQKLEILPAQRDFSESAATSESVNQIKHQEARFRATFFASAASSSPDDTVVSLTLQFYRLSESPRGHAACLAIALIDSKRQNFQMSTHMRMRDRNRFDISCLEVLDEGFRNESRTIPDDASEGGFK